MLRGSRCHPGGWHGSELGPGPYWLVAQVLCWGLPGCWDLNPGPEACRAHSLPARVQGFGKDQANRMCWVKREGVPGESAWMTVACPGRKERWKGVTWEKRKQVPAREFRLSPDTWRLAGSRKSELEIRFWELLAVLKRTRKGDPWGRVWIRRARIWGQILPPFLAVKDKGASVRNLRSQKEQEDVLWTGEGGPSNHTGGIDPCFWVWTCHLITY